MQTNVRKRDPVKPKMASPFRSSRVGQMQIKQACKSVARRAPYRVGYSWNKGGRLKELRIRHLARKFLKIWIQNTFGRVHPHKARSHNKRVVLLRAFEGWRDEWWTARREWSLTVRAECHYRYNLYNRSFHSWQKFVSLQRENKKKARCAQFYADRQRMRLVWDKWEVYLEMRRMKSRMHESALKQKRLTTLRSAWNTWQTKLQHRYDLHAGENQALHHWALTIQREAWFHWKEMHMVAISRREKESKASLHYIHRLQRKALNGWTSYVCCRQAKKKPQATAEHAWQLRLVKMCWSKWRSGLYRRRSEEDRWQAAGHLAKRSTQRRSMARWRTYVKLRSEEAEKDQMASQHQHHHFLHAGLRGLSLNVTWSKAQRLDKNMAVQYHRQTMTIKYWRLWQDRLEETEDKCLHSQMQSARTHYSTSLLSSFFHHWKEKLVEHRYIQELEHRAEAWFAERTLPHCFNSWVEFTLQRRLHRERRVKSVVYNQQRQYTWVFYTWWGESEKRKEQRLSGRMAILHDERWRLRRAWAHWRQRTAQQIDESEKRSASDNLYMHRLLQKTVQQWKDNSNELQDRRNQEKQACHHGDLRCMRWAMNGWCKFVQSQKEKKRRLEQIQHYHEAGLLKQTLQAWKERHLQTVETYGHAEQRYRLRKQHLLRRVLAVWRENAVFLAEARVKERRAQSHFQRCLQFKVLVAWRQATTRAVSKCHQQGEVLTIARSRIDHVWLQGTFRQWRNQTRKSVKERMDMEKARRHHNSKLLCRAVEAWNSHHCQYQKYEAMKRQGVLLLRLKTCQNFFERWKVELQHRRREAEQTELALWHWSLSLQAKVLYAWRLWVTGQHRKQERLAGAAHFYRNQLLREGVAYILTHTAHMNSLTASMAQHSQEQSSRHLQRVVQRCAMRWKQRALCKPGRMQEVGGLPPKKSVTFCLPTPGLQSASHGVSCSQSVEQGAEDGVLNQLVLTRTSRLQPRRPKELLNSPVKELEHNGLQRQSLVTNSDAANQLGGHQQLHLLAVPHPVGPSSPLNKGQTPVRSCLQPPTAPFTSRALAVTQSPLVPAMVCSEPSVDSLHGLQNQDVLLPPSSFMIANAQTKQGKTSSSCPGNATLLPPHQFILPLSHHSTYSGVSMRASSEEVDVENIEEEAEVDPTLALTGELLSIRLDMDRFQQDRKQLRKWKRLAQVLKTWLQSSGQEEQMEKITVRQELEELEECINRLSADLTKQKPSILLHAARVQHLETLLHSLGDGFLSRPPEERATDHSVFTT
ncbi:protein SFI1 homolog [Polymixia lowei]